MLTPARHRPQFAVVLLTICSLAVAFNAQAAKPKAKTKPAEAVPAQPAPEAKPAGNPGDPQKFISGLYDRLNQLSQKAPNLDVLHGQIGKELNTIVDYTEMARLTLGAKWDEVTPVQRTEFTDLLAKMVLNTYVRRFKPGSAVEITWGAAPKTLSEGKVKITSTITVKKTSADVQYALLPRGGQWWVFDIVVDDASQVQTYRQSFKKILDKEGWPGLVQRMRKAGQKKAG